PVVMPVHRDREKKENTAEEMEVEEQEHEASSSEEEDSDTSSVSEDGDSSEMDEEDCERRRMECLDEMSNLEKQFTDLKDQLYRERLSQVNSKLAEVEAGRAAEYLEPLAVLLENIQGSSTASTTPRSWNYSFCK
uniref:BRMS1 like transcriptional repressor b n=1 Tax=Amphiprion percula TaxID=161767 RepID=A0A3P8RTS3_AMPPE